MVASLRDRPSVVSESTLQALVHVCRAIELLESPGNLDTDALVHKVRKRIKKTRALVKLARTAVGKKAVGRVDRRLRDASRPLSQVRDAAALLSTLDQLEQRSIGLVASEPFEAARASLEAHKEERTRVVLGNGKTLGQTRKLLRAARRRIEGWELDSHRNRPFVGISQAYRSGRDAFRIAQADPTVEHLHDLRKRAKALDYQLGILEKQNPSGRPLRVRLLAGLLAGELGEWHDLELLHGFLEAETSSGPILKVLEPRRLDLRQGAIQRAGVIFQARPKAFVRSLKSAIQPTVSLVAESAPSPACDLLAKD